MTSGLDHIVKGAPLTHDSPSLKQEESFALASHGVTTDHLSTLPNSPSQIYLNLLILEASLRSQYLNLRAKRRQYTFFLLLLTIWTTYFFYALFLQPREDGGVGGSPYWVIEMGEKVALMAGVVTALLVWGTGQWEQGIRWPRRWLRVTNRGLRGFNSKLVIIKGPLWREMLSMLAFLFPISSPFASSKLSRDQVEAYNASVISQRRRSASRAILRSSPETELLSHEETDLSHGGNYVKLLLLPKAFSPDFRENWEIYRNEYWERENDRRARLRLSITAREKELARQYGGWFWFIGWWTGSWKPREERPLHGSLRLRDHDRRSTLSGRSDSHSRNSSRSVTPTADIGEDKAMLVSEKARRSNTGPRKRVRATSSISSLSRGKAGT